MADVPTTFVSRRDDDVAREIAMAAYATVAATLDAPTRRSARARISVDRRDGTLTVVIGPTATCRGSAGHG